MRQVADTLCAESRRKCWRVHRSQTGSFLSSSIGARVLSLSGISGCTGEAPFGSGVSDDLARRSIQPRERAALTLAKLYRTADRDANAHAVLASGRGFPADPTIPRTHRGASPSLGDKPLDPFPRTGQSCPRRRSLVSQRADPIRNERVPTNVRSHPYRRPVGQPSRLM
jgi:hypothetical protein